MEKNEEWGVGGKWAEKEGYVQNERKREKKGEIKKEREKDAEGRQLSGRDNDKDGDGRVNLLNTKAYLDRRLLHLGPREKVCWIFITTTSKMCHGLDFELPK